jgi:membrane-associated phospholipid phosphatase
MSRSVHAVVGALLLVGFAASPIEAQSSSSPDRISPVAASAAPASSEAQPTPCGLAASDATAPVPLGAPSFRHIFTGALHGFGHLPSKPNALWLTLGAGFAVASLPADHEIGEDGHEPPVAGFTVGNAMGHAAIHFGAGLASYVVGRASGHVRVAVLGANLVEAQLVSGALVQGLKLASRRERPNGTNRQSFPSGHAATMFATATVVERHYGWKAALPLYLAGAYVGAARIETRQHYLSDVTFGAAVGIVAGRAVTIGSGRARFALEPMVGPGGVGISFRKTQ